MPAILRIILILFVVVWVFSGWPQMYGFPPKVREVYAQAFPVVEARLATNGGNSASSPLTVNLPADIQAGELLLVFLSVRTPSTMSWPTGWTEFFSGDNGTDAGLRVAYRQATGAEGSSISVTPGASSKHVAVAFRDSGAENPTTQAPQASTAATGSRTTPDPGTITP
ncbi:MAG: hypothetical protein Q8P12_03415, partial [bacterium]|nr:hypothetical protein [bacterium]